MVLESTMICVDDSDFMRNGDFVPTRLAAVQDAVNILCLSKTRANPENNVGLLTMASSEVLTTLTTDVSKLMSKLLAVQPQGELKLMSGLRVAHLALKHRQGKNHKMRIILFVGSPLEGVDQGELVRLAKRLKKEKVNVDIVSFGEEKGNQDVLNAFVDALNGKDGTASRLVVVPPGPNLTDALVQSPILQTEDGAPVPGIGAGGYDFGMDGDDPELALALRVSMEEQRARQEAEARASNPEAGTEGATNEEQMLEQALAMSMDARPTGRSSAAAPDFSAMSEDEQIAYAMQMSMQEQAPVETKPQRTAEHQVPDSLTEEAMDIDEINVIPTIQDNLDETAEFSTEHLQEVLERLPTPTTTTTRKDTSSVEKDETSPKSSASSTAKKPSDDKKKPDPKSGNGQKKK